MVSIVSAARHRYRRKREKHSSTNNAGFFSSNSPVDSFSSESFHLLDTSHDPQTSARLKSLKPEGKTAH